MTRWYRAYEGMVTDRKIVEAALISGAKKGACIAAWACILDDCCGQQADGAFRLTARSIAGLIDEPISVAEAILAAFAELGMVEGQTVPSWSRRQFKSDSSTDRVREHRKRLVTTHETPRNGDETLQKQDVAFQKHDGTAPDTESDTDTESSPPIVPPSGVDAAKPKREAHGSRLPGDWQPSSADQGFAAKQGMTPAEIDHQAEQFRDYWAAKAGAGGRKADWAATWRTWIRRSVEMHGGKVNLNGSDSKTDDGKADDVVERALAKLAARGGESMAGGP